MCLRSWNRNPGRPAAVRAGLPLAASSRLVELPAARRGKQQRVAARPGVLGQVRGQRGQQVRRDRHVPHARPGLRRPGHRSPRRRASSPAAPGSRRARRPARRRCGAARPAPRTVAGSTRPSSTIICHGGRIAAASASTCSAVAASMSCARLGSVPPPRTRHGFDSRSPHRSRPSSPRSAAGRRWPAPRGSAARSWRATRSPPPP